MEIRPTPEQEAFIRQAINAGRLQSSEDAAREAMALWEQRERRRLEILAAVDDAELSLAVGTGLAGSDEALAELADNVKYRGRERLARERSAG